MEEVSDPDEWCNIHYGFGTMVLGPWTMRRHQAVAVGKQAVRNRAMEKAMETRDERENSGI